MKKLLYALNIILVSLVLHGGKTLLAQTSYETVWKDIYLTSTNEYYAGSIGYGISSYSETQDAILGKYFERKYRSWAMFPFQSLNLDGFQVFSAVFLIANVTNAGASNSLVTLRKWSYSETPKRLTEPGYLPYILYNQLELGSIYAADLDIFRTTGIKSKSLGQSAIDEFNGADLSGQEYFIISMTEKNDDSEPNIQLSTQDIHLKVAYVDYSPPSASASITEGNPDIDISADGNYTVFFSPSEDLQSGIKRYVVKEYFNGSPIETKNYYPPFQLNWVRSNQPEGNYYYTVQAFNGSGVPGDLVASDGVIVDFPPPPPSIERLSNGGHSPNSGTWATQFNFHVQYQSSTNLPPNTNSIKLNFVGGTTHTLSPGGGNWQNGVTFDGIISNLGAGQHQYYFSGQVGNKSLRFPEGNQNLTINITEPVQGWDLQVLEVTSTPSSITPGASFTGKGKLLNNSNSPDKIYYNVPYEFRFYNSTGALIDTKTGTIPQVSQAQQLTISESFTAPSNNGTCNLVFSVNVPQDEYPENNTASKPIVVSSTGPQYKWYVSDSDAWVQMNSQNPTHYFEGYTYTIVLANNTKVTIKRSNNNYDINRLNLRMFDSQSIIVINEECSSSSPPTGWLSFGKTTSGEVDYESTNVTSFQGQTVEFVANTSSGIFSASDPDIYLNNEGGTVKPWYNSFSRTNGNQTIKLRFYIPSNASVGTYNFYCAINLNNNNTKFVAQLVITVIAPPPSVSSLSKTNFSADDEITINGSNFGNSAGSVYFNSLAAASIVSWSSTSIRCIVPSGVQSGGLYVTTAGGPSNSYNYSIISSTGNPVVLQQIPDFSIKPNENRLVADLRQIFSDPNGGNLIFTFASAFNAISANLDSLLNGKLIVSVASLNRDNDRIIVTAKDPTNKTISDTVDVSINLVDPPSTATCFAINFNPGKLFLTWSDNNLIEDGYKIERKTSASSWTEIAQVSSNVIAFTDVGLNSNTIYFYRVRAFKGTFNSQYGPEVSDTTLVDIPPAPTGIGSQTLSAYSIRVTWNDNSALELGFKIERKNPGSNDWLEIALVGAGVTSYADTGLTPNKSYSYRIKAFNNTGTSNYSNPTTSQTFDVIPANPLGLTANSDPGSPSVVQLSWYDVSTNETGFRIERTLDSTSNWVQIAQVTTSAYRDSALLSGTTYFYRVRAFNNIGNSGYSNTAFATTPETLPAPPDSLRATTVNSSVIQLNWADKSHNETGFKLERKDPVNLNWTEIAVISQNTKTYLDTGLTQNTLYSYRIRSFNQVGNSQYSNIVSTTTLDLAPLPPSSLSAQASGSKKIIITWNDNSLNETSFIIERKISSGGSWVVIDSVMTNIIQYTDSLLTPATWYFYRVRALNQIGYSSYSNTDSAKTDDIAPLAPSNLQLSALSKRIVQLSWQDNSGNETGFKILRRTGFSAGWSVIDSTSADETSFVDTLDLPTFCVYRIFAFNPFGESNYSDSVFTDLTSIKLSISSMEIPKEFDLYQNYPNPFNPSTIVRFAIPREANVKLEIFSVDGNLIKVIQDDSKQPGYYEVNLEMTSFSSGVYFYRISAVPNDNSDPFIQTRKLILLK